VTTAESPHHRKSIRLKGYDYTRPGAYFVTICFHGGDRELGYIANGQIRLSPIGEIVSHAWHDLPNHYPHILLDEFMIMPNHVHGIIILAERPVVGAGLRPAPTGPAPTGPAPTPCHGLSEIVRAFKSFSARRINEYRNTPGVPVWQRNYYEHIIRDDRSLNAIRQYIHSNPQNWKYDRNNPSALPCNPKSQILED
jgi:putative transposase